ncbi:MAG: hypothetical protein ONB48_20720 [candidate division KSB1 bacterium]|nr:hypothetical protein [candidate division KSB1 bacterium]MDZ7276401.1 hypothetical protein [candidate division KSB1 bacterium]MDZ7288072.1 hypothetical protein [candidate division KSB1 bacterium]MDZ7300172.1 hypothetical protein [candidate division KSB1 bacterium]MDZ7308830.1 hypothetical protein [candidate division KSB1 bacterium]
MHSENTALPLPPFFVPATLAALDNFQQPSPAGLAALVAALRRPAIGFGPDASSWQRRALSAWHAVARAWENWRFPDAEKVLDQLENATRMSRTVLRESIANHFRVLVESDMQDWLAEMGTARASLAPNQTLPELAFIIAAGNIPGVAIQPLVQLSLLGIPTLVKSASEEPYLLPALLATLAQQDAEIAGLLAALSWPRSQQALTQAVLGAGPAVIAFGDDATVAQLRHAAPPQYVPLGDRFSAVLLETSAARPEILRRLAHDYIMFDGKGCLAPQVVLVIADTWAEVANLALHFAGILAEETRRWPAGNWSLAEKALIQQWRGEWRAQRAAGGNIVLYEPPDTSWTVVAAEDCDLSQRVAFRVVRLCRVGSLQQAMQVVHNHRHKLQALAVALAEEQELARFTDDLAEDDELTGRLICAPGYLQCPPFAWLDVNHAWLRLLRGL